ncbi:MAG TPA: oxidoreductase [bacterium]|nr:oxidoreductase [bacterium]
MAEKKKLNLAIYWAGACGGCDVSILDTDEKILDIAAAADIKFWPIAMDYKVSDVEALKDNELDVTLFNGAVRNSEQLHLAQLLRKKSKILISYGSCAYLGGIPGLANFSNKEAILERVYKTSESVETNGGAVYPSPKSKVPEGEVEIPELHDYVKALHQVVDVDYFLPGCPPTTDLINLAVNAIITGKLPPKGAVIAADKNLCDSCKRKKTEEKSVKRFYRPHEIIPDNERCLLEQGILCMGPATRGGCGARCIEANMPCRGCFGPAPGVEDMGAKMLAAAASVIDARTPEEAASITATLPDVAGTFYRFNLPVSLLRRAK